MGMRASSIFEGTDALDVGQKHKTITNKQWTMLEFFAGSGLVACGLNGLIKPIWANDICAKANLTPDIQDTGLILGYVLQHNQTDLEFLLERAHRIGFEVVG